MAKSYNSYEQWRNDCKDEDLKDIQEMFEKDTGCEMEFEDFCQSFYKLGIRKTDDGV
jgi:hypothetical protein